MSGCSPYTRTYNYRLSIFIRTPTGISSGSSIINVVTTPAINPGNILPWSQVYTRVKGQAVYIDLPNGCVLFALLCSPDGITNAAGGYALNALIPRWKRFDGNSYKKGIDMMLKNKNIGEVLSSYYPMFVTFGDINDPNTIEIVKPENFAKVFGDGYGIDKITAQITSDEETKDINKKLPWLRNVYQRLREDFNPQGIPLGDFKSLFQRGSH